MPVPQLYALKALLRFLGPLLIFGLLLAGLVMVAFGSGAVSVEDLLRALLPF